MEETVNGNKRKTKAINVLRRLVANTMPIINGVPLTSDEKLNNLMNKIKD